MIASRRPATLPLLPFIGPTVQARRQEATPAGEATGSNGVVSLPPSELPETPGGPHLNHEAWMLIRHKWTIQWPTSRQFHQPAMGIKGKAKAGQPFGSRVGAPYPGYAYSSRGTRHRMCGLKAMASRVHPAVTRQYTAKGNFVTLLFFDDPEDRFDQLLSPFERRTSLVCGHPDSMTPQGSLTGACRQAPGRLS